MTETKLTQWYLGRYFSVIMFSLDIFAVSNFVFFKEFLYVWSVCVCMRFLCFFFGSSFFWLVYLSSSVLVCLSDYLLFCLLSNEREKEKL